VNESSRFDEFELLSCSARDIALIYDIEFTSRFYLSFFVFSLNAFSEPCPGNIDGVLDGHEQKVCHFDTRSCLEPKMCSGSKGLHIWSLPCCCQIAGGTPGQPLPCNCAPHDPTPQNHTLVLAPRCSSCPTPPGWWVGVAKCSNVGCHGWHWGSNELSALV